MLVPALLNPAYCPVISFIYCSDISKVQFFVGAIFYSLLSSLKTYHRTLHFTPWSLDLFIHVPFQPPGEHTVLQPFRRIELTVHIAIFVLPGTHFHQVKHLRVKCLAQGHPINVPRLRGEKHDISLEILHQAGFETARQQRHRQSATL